MKFHEVQQAAKDCLSANAYFAGLEILLEADPAETDPKKLAEIADRFEKAIGDDGKGIAIVILSPYASRLSLVKKGGISCRVHVPVAIAENCERNRSAGGFGKPSLEVLEEVISTLLAKFEFSERPFGRPEMENGLLLYYAQAETVHHVRAKS